MINKKCNKNINNILFQRELTAEYDTTNLKKLLEDSLIKGSYTQRDFPLPSTVSSTIAIALSCDGNTVGII